MLETIFYAVLIAIAYLCIGIFVTKAFYQHDVNKTSSIKFWFDVGIPTDIGICLTILIWPIVVFCTTLTIAVFGIAFIFSVLEKILNINKILRFIKSESKPNNTKFHRTTTQINEDKCDSLLALFEADEIAASLRNKNH